jgi:hypothetical protein
MKAKAILERLTGSGVAVATPTADEETEAKRGVAAGRLKEMVDAAVIESGNLCRNLAEWRGVRHILTSRRIKSRLAVGMPEARAQREVDIELDAEEDEIRRCTADSLGYAQQLEAARARAIAADFERAAALMAALDADLETEIGEVVARLRPFHARALVIRDLLVATSGNEARRIPDSRPYLGLRFWTLGELAARAVTLHTERQ